MNTYRHDNQLHDVVIVGGGIGGTTLAAVLARHGLDVLLLEGGSHPRFTIGESTIPETTLLLRVLATRYDVPELAYLSTYGGTRRHVTSACGVKRNFSFFRHSDGVAADPAESTQLPTFSPPLGPDCHLFRQDVDAWLFHLAVGYGTRALVNEMVTDVEFDDESVCVTTAAGARHRGRFLVDAGGIRAVLPTVLGLRDEQPAFETRTRSLFSHMAGVAPWETVAGGRKACGLPSPPSQGTLHHVFDGGWMWVIPFDNHHGASNRLTSVGLSLDPEKFPADERGPAAEFEAFKARFPDIASQFTHAVAARPWVSSPRLQYSSKTVVGDRFCLAAHAAGFVDPLYSRGLTSTFEVVNALAWRLIAASRDGDWSTERFRYVDQLDRGLLETHDDLVHSSFNSFADYDLWNATFRTWALGTVLGTLHLEAIYFDFVRHRDASVFLEREAAKYVGSPFPLSEGFNDLMKSTLARNRAVVGGELAAARAAKEIMADIRCADYVPPPFGFSDAGNHYIHPTPPKMAQAVAWSKRSAPPEIGPLIRGALAGFARERVRGHI